MPRTFATAILIVGSVVGAAGGRSNAVIASDYPTSDHLFQATGALVADDTWEIVVTGRGGVPATGVDSVAINVTATNPTTASFLTVWPTGTPRPTASNLNFDTGQTIPNLAIAKVGTDGRISIYNLAGTVDVIIDVVGWFPTGGGYTSLTPARLADTRQPTPTSGIRLSVGMSRSAEWLAVRTGVLARPAQDVRLRVATNPTEACSTGASGVVGIRAGSCTVEITTSGRTTTAVIDVVDAPQRSSTDRSGPNVLDIKPLYIRLSDSPDAGLDVSGHAADFAQDLADWVAVQNPGFTLRVDTVGGVPDVQYIQLDLTTAEFLAAWTDNVGPLPAMLERLGITSNWHTNSPTGYTDMKRLYVGFVDAPRGAYRSPNSNPDPGCGSSTGSSTMLYYVRNVDGSACSPMIQSYTGPSTWWQGYDAIRLMVDLLNTNAGCDAQINARWAVPLEQRPESLTPPDDVVAYGYRNGGYPKSFDPTHAYYFKIAAGPDVANVCRDVAYSPFMTEIDRVEQPPNDRRAGRSFGDRPDDTAGPQVQVLYVLPADVPDEGLDVDGSLHRAVTSANDWLYAHGGRRVRYDTFGGTLDTTFVRLPYTEAQMWVKPFGSGAKCSGSCPHVADVLGLLDGLGVLSPGKIHVVVYGGAAAPASRASGLSCSIAAPAELGAMVYRGMRHLRYDFSECRLDVVTSGAASQNSLGLMMTHELFHVLGAVGDAAPNAAQGHIRNDPSDLMGGSVGSVQLDPGRDDYWGHGNPGYTDVSRSVFMVPTVADPENPPFWSS